MPGGGATSHGAVLSSSVPAAWDHLTGQLAVRCRQQTERTRDSKIPFRALRGAATMRWGALPAGGVSDTVTSSPPRDVPSNKQGHLRVSHSFHGNILMIYTRSSLGTLPSRPRRAMTTPQLPLPLHPTLLATCSACRRTWRTASVPCQPPGSTTRRRSGR